MRTGMTQFMAALAALAKNHSVLDVGCVGSAGKDNKKHFGIHEFLAEHAREMYGIDIDAAGIGEMKEKGYACETAAVESFVSTKTYDVVMVLSVLQFSPNPVAALANIRRALVPNGCLVVHVPYVYAVGNIFRAWCAFDKERNAPKRDRYQYTEGQSPYGEVSIFDAASLTNVLANAGFVCETVSTYITKPLSRGKGFRERARLFVNNGLWYVSKKCGPTLMAVARKS